MYFFDSHAHFEDKGGEDGYDAVVARAVEAGTTKIMAIGGSDALNTAALGIAVDHPEHVRATIGFDRDQAEGFAATGRDAALRSLEETLDERGDVLGIGEVGLDYHYSPESAPDQKALFEAQLSLARRRSLPVVIHNRDSDEDMLKMLAAHVSQWRGDPDRIGVLHCFTGSEAFAKQLIDIGMYISFSGIVTFRNADSLRAAAALVPVDRILVETDSPYLAPVPLRGKRNEPAYVQHVAETLASVRGETTGTIAEQTATNASRLFGWE
jgi:TatD DNase family protein